MFQAAIQMLDGKDPAEIAVKSGIFFDGEAYLIESLGRTFRLSYPEYLFDEQLSEWHRLIIMHYLNLADGFPLTGEAITLSDMPDGVIRGTKFDRTAADAICKFLLGKSEDKVKLILEKMGAEFLPGKADMNVKLPFLPRFPLYLNIWFADDEFPPSARLLVDRSAGHYLTVEDAVMTGDLVLALFSEIETVI